MKKVRDKKYVKLQAELKERGLYPRDYLADQMGMSEATLNLRFTSASKWDLVECYKLLDLIQKPYSDMPIYFPREDVFKAVNK